jgi:hypothetical protein
MQLLGQLGAIFDISRNWPEPGTLKGLSAKIHEAIGIPGGKPLGTTMNSTMERGLGL